MPAARRSSRRSSSRKKKARSPGALLAALVLLAVVFAAGIYLGRGLQPVEEGETSLSVDQSEPAAERPEPRALAPEVVAGPEPGSVPAFETARVALVIDDLGRSVEDVDRLQALGIPISYSVLPFEILTQSVVRRLRERGLEYLCHLPMEPSHDANPGPGALLSAMDDAEMVVATRKALDAVAGAVGVNNHMGSGLTADARAMEIVGQVLARRDLFFLDSRTTADSVAYEVIQELGVPSAERQVFLDPDLGPEAIREQFLRLLEIAREQGAAIGIGHPHPATFQVLGEEVPRALEEGIEFIPVSYLLERSSDPS